MTANGTNSYFEDMESLFIRHLLETAVRYADKTAIVDMGGKRPTTYGQLLDLARKVAAYLRQQGVDPHSNLCVRMPDTMEFMAAEIGVWLSRCAVVPISMNSPEERADAIARNCGSALLIDKDVMLKVKDANVSDAEEITLPESTDDALIIYTSGSTGVPKGIIHTFEPFDKNYPHTFGLAAPSAEMVFGNGVPFYFMAIVFLYDMICAGATVHLYSANVKTEREAVLLGIARKVLGTEELGVADNLMDWGMDSISAVEMVNLADDAGIKIRASELLVLKTVREISKSIMSLVYWHSSFTGRKPILVLSCGIIGTEQLENRIESLAEHYDILVIEPFLEHYLYLVQKDESFESVVGLYYDLMDMVIPDTSRIVAFMGFSFGGTIAYELCRMLFLHTGRACKVICGDSPIFIPSLYSADP